MQRLRYCLCALLVLPLGSTAREPRYAIAFASFAPLNTDIFRKWSPHWNTDGRIGYVSGGSEGGVEFVTGAAGARGEMESPSWSPDGRHMVFHRDIDSGWPPLHDWPSRDPAFRLVRSGVFPSYSPAGDRFVENDHTAGILHNSILVMNADGSKRSVLFTDPKRSALAPAWSPQGDRIAFGLGGFFQAVIGQSSADIAVMRTDGTDVQILTNGSGNVGLPSWSPDGRRLVYRAAGDNRSGLSIIDIETRAVKVMTTGAGHENFPSWSPKGDRIAFTSARGGFKDESALHQRNPQPYGDIYVMRADGSDVRKLTDNQFEEGTPSWLPTKRAP